MSIRKTLSVVVSVYNEELSLKQFYEVIHPILEDCTWEYELIFVNDGSSDNSMDLLESFAKKNKKAKLINFSRNFGHEAAMIAGIDYAKGDGVICMDADLQHPPASISSIIDKFDEGYEVISMIRSSREDGSIIKKITSSLFYNVLNILSPVKFERNSSDFFAISCSVVNVLQHEYRERVRYLRGYVQSVGFKKTTLKFEAKSRIAGESKYNINQLFHFSVTTLCSFSDIPLKLGIYTGALVAVVGFIFMLYSIVNKILNGAPSGYSTVIVAMCFMFAIVLVVIGIIGQYISVLFSETKNRPIYIVENFTNMKDDKSQ